MFSASCYSASRKMLGRDSVILSDVIKAPKAIHDQGIYFKPLTLETCSLFKGCKTGLDWPRIKDLSKHALSCSNIVRVCFVFVVLKSIH